MIRGPLFHLFLAFLPFIIYWIFMAFAKKRMKQTDGKWNPKPYLLLFLCGLFLSGGSMVFLGLSSDGTGADALVPNRLIDGEIVRGSQ